MTWGEQNTESQAHEQLDYAFAQGVNFIDTAEMYPVPPNGRTQGQTETIVGRWLARQPRDKLVVASKVAGPGRRAWIRGGRTDLTRDVIAEACGTSLARLRTDYLDIFQIHWPQRNVPTFGALEFDPAKEREGPSIREQVEGMAALDQGRQDPPLRPVQRDDVGGVRIPSRRARARACPVPSRCRTATASCRARRPRPRGGAVPREDVAARVQPARDGRAHRQVRRTAPSRAGARFTLFDDFGLRYRKPDRVRGDRCVREARETARPDARRACARLREKPLVPRRHDHRRDDGGAACGGHQGRAGRARRADARRRSRRSSRTTRIRRTRS